MDELVFQFGTRFLGRKFSTIPPKGQFVFSLLRFPLVPGRYWIDAYLYTGAVELDFILKVSPLDVIDGDYYQSGYCILEKETKFLVNGTVTIRESR